MSLKQLDFLYLTQTNTNIIVPKLEPNAVSFFQSIPSSLSNCFLHPNFFEVFSAIQLPAAIDNFLIIGFCLMCLIFSDRKKMISPLFPFFVLTPLLFFTFVGVIVSNLGALVRYKSIAMMIFVLAFLFLVDIRKLKRF